MIIHDLSSGPKFERYHPNQLDLNNKNNNHSLIIELIGENKDVLEIGTSTGDVTRILKEKGNRVIGIDVDEEAGEVSKQYCDSMNIADIEELDLDDHLASCSFDVILLADVLEHLRCPCCLLRAIQKYLKPDGYLVVSLPNVTHGDILLNLLNSDFRYSSVGLLDEAHLRFFGEKNIVDIFNSSGYEIKDLREIKVPIGFTELRIDLDKIPAELIKFLKSIPNSDVYYFVFTAVPSDDLVSETILETDFFKSFNISIEDIIKKHKSETDNLVSQLSQANAKANTLEQEIAEMRRSIAWQIVLRFHESFVERALPQGSRRRRGYDLGLKGCRILANEGPRSLFWNTKEFVKSRNSRLNDYDAWVRNNEPSDSQLNILAQASKEFNYRPKISIVMPVWNTPKGLLQAAIDSILAQTYENWELCIADGGSENTHIARILNEYSARDKRIKFNLIGENKGIAENTNEALSLATGEFVALLDHDDSLAPFALYEIANHLNEMPFLKFIYSDEDKIDTKGQRFDPFFKPDWSPDLLFSCGYTNHLGVYRADVLKHIGGFRKSFEGSQDYDMLLRFIEVIDESEIGHISKILYHWRQIPGSTAVDPYAKNCLVVSAAKRALKDALDRGEIKADVLDGKWPSSYRVKREILGEPLVSVIILTKDRLTFLNKCINSIKDKTTYRNYELIVVDNNSEEPETLSYLKSLDARVLRYEKEFNFSRINNFAAEYANGDYLIFLNNDTEVITPDWVQAMLEHAQRPEVGAVGCKLLYPDRSIQHAGVVLGLSPDQMTGIAGHIFNKFRYEDPGYFGLINTVRNYSAVTAAAMMIKKSVFDEVGGFNEDLAVCYNDVDLCLRLRESGYRIIYTPYSELYHYESVSRGSNVDLHEAEYMLNKWGTVIKNDPYYSHNLSLKTYDCRIDF